MRRTFHDVEARRSRDQRAGGFHFRDGAKLVFRVVSDGDRGRRPARAPG